MSWVIRLDAKSHKELLNRTLLTYVNSLANARGPLTWAESAIVEGKRTRYYKTLTVNAQINTYVIIHYGAESLNWNSAKNAA